MDTLRHICEFLATAQHHGRRFLAGLAVLATIVVSLLNSKPAGAAEPIRLSVDAAQVLGSTRPLHGVNCGPLVAGGILDLSAAQRELAPPLVRLHDCHWPVPDVVDLHVLFPNFAADPQDPKSYDFARTDRYVQAIVACGSGIVFRLGESIEHDPPRRFVHPPADAAKWAQICLGVIRHYNEGWAKGLRLNIRYWEIWNEPDNRPAMWSGDDDDYLKLYTVAAKAIRAAYPDLRVGGPAVGNSGDLVEGVLRPPAFVSRFWRHCEEQQVPLDFFSWHVYTADPRQVAQRAREVRRLLNEHGLAKTESHLNEWNYLPGDNWGPMMSPDAQVRERWGEAVGGPAGAAFAAATLLLMQDEPLDAACYFSADNQGFGLFNAYGRPKKSWHAFHAVSQWTKAGQRLAVKGEAAAGIVVGAAGGPEQVVVLISNYAGPAQTFELSCEHLPWNGGSRYTTEAIDEQRDLTVAARGDLAAGGKLAFEAPKHAVLFMRITPAGK